MIGLVTCQCRGEFGEVVTQSLRLRRGKGRSTLGVGAGLLGNGNGNGRVGDGLLAPLLFGGQVVAKLVGFVRVGGRCAAGLFPLVLGYRHGGDGLLAALLFGGQSLTEPVGFVRVGGRCAARLFPLALGLADLALLLGKPASKLGKLTETCFGLLLQLGDAGGGGGVQGRQLGAVFLGGGTRGLGVTLAGLGLSGGPFGLNAGALVLADLAPGFLLALFGAVAGRLGLLPGVVSGGDPCGGCVGRGDRFLFGGRGRRACFFRGLFGRLDLGEGTGAQCGQLGAERILRALPMGACGQQRGQQILNAQQRVGDRGGMGGGARPVSGSSAGVAAVLGAAAAAGQGLCAPRAGAPRLHR
ncbi:hypothetical protein ACIBH1_12110 [Nonomuraea sp. NPDC050663]|uniref:hypothetical protein n=1 Tax=Nonomuraea sp. NPDC050663 TaxID=3364370 RepID=UPI00379504D2